MTTAIHPFSPEEIMAYQDGELSPQRAIQASQHLAVCRECRSLVEGLQKLSTTLSAWDLEPVNAAPPIRLRESLPTTAIPFWRRKWLIGVSVGIVLLAVAIVNLPRPMTRFVKDDSSVLQPAYMAARRGASAGIVSSSSESLSSESKQERATTLPTGPKISRSAQISLISSDFSRIRSAIERIVAAQAGYVSQLQMNMQSGTSRSLSASLKIPATHLDAAINELKQLGYVSSESQGGEDVTQPSVDLDVRLSNLKTTEARLRQILANRAGKLSEVLEVEEAVDRTLGEIESAEARQKVLANQVSYAAVQIYVSEEYKSALQNDNRSVLVRLRNAGVDGYRNAVDVVLAALIFLLSVGPASLLVMAVLFFPAIWLWKRWQRTRNANVL